VNDKRTRASSASTESSNATAALLRSCTPSPATSQRITDCAQASVQDPLVNIGSCTFVAPSTSASLSITSLLFHQYGVQDGMVTLPQTLQDPGVDACRSTAPSRAPPSRGPPSLSIIIQRSRSLPISTTHRIVIFSSSSPCPHPLPY